MALLLRLGRALDRARGIADERTERSRREGEAEGGAHQAVKTVHCPPPPAAVPGSLPLGNHARRTVAEDGGKGPPPINQGVEQ